MSAKTCLCCEIGRQRNQRWTPIFFARNTQLLYYSSGSRNLDTTRLSQHAYVIRHVRRVALIREVQEMNVTCERRSLVENMIELEIRASADSETDTSDCSVPGLFHYLRRFVDIASCCLMLPRGTLTFAVLFGCLCNDCGPVLLI